MGVDEGFGWGVELRDVGESGGGPLVTDRGGLGGGDVGDGNASGAVGKIGRGFDPKAIGGGWAQKEAKIFPSVVNFNAGPGREVEFEEGENVGLGRGTRVADGDNDTFGEA